MYNVMISSQKKFVKSTDFILNHKHCGKVLLENAQCSVEITEIYSHAFLAKLSWKQRIY